MSEKEQIVWIRGLIVVFVAISAIIAVFQYKGAITFIAQLMGISWGTLAGAFLGPLVWSLYSKRTSKASVWVSFIFAVVFMCMTTFMPSIFPAWLRSPINAGAICMVISLIIVPIISLFTPAPGKGADVDAAFASYDRTVTVKVKDDLGNA